MVIHAYSLEETPIAGEGDEVWECDDSEVESCTNSDSEKESDTELPLPPSPVATQVKHVLQYKGLTAHKMPAPPGVQVRTVQTPAKMYPSPARQQADVQVRSAQSPSIQSSSAATQLALNLRRDNERLRELLVEAQRQAEEAMEQGDNKSNVDFAHLLDLVKEFGTGIGDSDETDKGDDSAEMCMSFNTQEYRMDEDDVDEKDTEIRRLESELAELKEKLKMQESGIRPLRTAVDEESSMELVGYWVSSKTGELHHVVRADTDTDIDAPDATEWEIVDLDHESVTLKSDSGIEHTIERLKTRMFGESLLWGSGDLWTPHSEA